MALVKRRLTLDFETRSECDLKKSGAYKYSLHPSTKPTCLAYKERERPVKLFRFEQINKPWGKLPQSFRSQWVSFITCGFEFAAHNAFFEQCIYYNILVDRYGWPDIPREQWRCTAAMAAACALPRNLEGAGAAMELTTQKDKRGFIAMMATCKPTKEWNAWLKVHYKLNAKGDFTTPRNLSPPSRFLEPSMAPDTWNTLYEYCKIDVITEELLDKSLPDLIPEEQEIWLLNQKLNWRGLNIDMITVRKIVDIMAVESKVRLKELDSLTMGLVTKAGARQSILDFLALEGIKLPDIRAKTVEDVLASNKVNGDMRRLLEIRKALSKTSTKKYQSFLDRAGSDQRVRDILLYHGASTGRDTGTGIQPHNFPRGAIRIDLQRPYAAVENVIECDTETLKLLYGENLSILFSSILRNMITASDGCELFVADFSKIEVAVLWWLADNKPGLKILHSGKDPYIYMAAANTGKSYEEIERAVEAGENWAIDARQLGKAQILGGGFGMGWMKFQSTGWDMYRLKLTDTQSKNAINSYRQTNPTVPKMWKGYEQAAVAAIKNPGTSYSTNKCIFRVERKFLWIQLPSGRKLAYRKPRIGWRETDYGPRQTVEFMGLGPNKKMLVRERTWGGTLTENIVQAVARDLMMPAMVRLEKGGYRALLMVHDEALTEREIGKGSIEEFLALMLERPKWADRQLPLDAKAWKGPRYRK